MSNGRSSAPCILSLSASETWDDKYINYLNKEENVISITTKVFTHSFQSFKIYIKMKIIDSYT